MIRIATLAAAALFAFDVSTACADKLTARQFWETLHRYETTALNDHRSRNMSPVVLARSETIWKLQTSSYLEGRYSACAAAAQNLSQMVASTYRDARRGHVQEDWYHLSPHYRRERSRCLGAIGLSDDNYPLPWWFGQ